MCNQVKNRQKIAKKLERAKDRLEIGAKDTTRNNSFEDAANALLVEISKMSFVSIVPTKGQKGSEAAKPFEGQAQKINLRSPKEAKIENDDIDTEILEGLSEADAEKNPCRRYIWPLTQRHVREMAMPPLSTREMIVMH